MAITLLEGGCFNSYSTAGRLRCEEVMTPPKVFKVIPDTNHEGWYLVLTDMGTAVVMQTSEGFYCFNCQCLDCLDHCRAVRAVLMTSPKKVLVRKYLYGDSE